MTKKSKNFIIGLSNFFNGANEKMRVLAINDVSCVGKCSLTVALPVISACGVTCDILPTAVLSTHTGGFEGYTFRDFSKDIKGILKHWKSLNLKFDIIYSGYLGNISQIEMVAEIKNQFLSPDGFFVVDPVMGDNGNLYKGFTKEFVAKMQSLCKQADYILPNLTEACALANLPYPCENIHLVLKHLSKLCKTSIVTGIVEDKAMAVHYLDKTGDCKKYLSSNVEGFFHGAGDVFASAFVGCLAKGKSQEESIRLATDFTSASVRRSAIEVEDKRYGLNFEAEIFTFLKNLNG